MEILSRELELKHADRKYHCCNLVITIFMSNLHGGFHERIFYRYAKQLGIDLMRFSMYILNVSECLESEVVIEKFDFFDHNLPETVFKLEFHPEMQKS